MSLQEGQRLGPYRVVKLLGSGGMGEVYRATDTKLRRDVAIKVLPEGFAQDREHLARFEREAHLLASLNHPNIASIYGLEEDDGKRCLVLELVEGETLAERIAGTALPLDEALGIARQVAEALETAHEKGIIHRDLKPANVMITPEGNAKVLDFGLAKALAPETPDPDMSLSPTMTAAATQVGMIMGTAAYMSPEQARGKPVDRRADIWAFGCVLYEMLVGGKPFAGTDVSEMMALIITQDPDLARLPTRLPTSIKDLIRRCLRKDVRMRLPDIGAARIALQEANEAPDAVATEGGASPRASSRLPLALALAAGLILGLLIAWGITAPPPAADSSPATHFELVLDPPPAHWAMALSSNGGSVIYSGRREGERQLYVRDLGGYTSRPLAGTEAGLWPVFSPDGQKLAFFSAGRLKTINLQGGGLPEPVCGVAGQILGAIWTADNRIIYSTNVTVVPQQVNADGGEPEPVSIIDLEDGAHVVMPRSLPGGRAILATLAAPSLDGQRVVVLDLVTGELKILARGQDAIFVEPETLLYIQKDRVMVAPFHPYTQELTGPERQAGLETPALSRSLYEEYARFYAAASPSGTLLYPAGRFGLSSKTYWLDRDGETRPTGLEGAMPRLDSTDRYAVADVKGNVWLLDLQEGLRTQVTFNATSTYPMWTADNKKIIFGDRRTGSYLPYALAADGRGEMKLLVDEDAIEDIPSPISSGSTSIPTSRFPDGRLLIYVVNPKTNRDIWALHPDGTLEPVLRTEANERAGTISRDGKLLAYVSDEEGSDEVYVRELPDTGRRWRVSRAGGLSPVWSHDGRELFFRTGDTIMATTVNRDGSLRVGEPQAVYTNHRLDLDRWGNKTFDAASDGRLLISMTDPDDVRTRIVLNWDPAVRTNSLE